MILTCPQCASRFILSAQALAPDGRRVKCSTCDEIWFQEPDEDEIHDDGEDGEVTKNEDGDIVMEDVVGEDIPDAVKPIQQDDREPASGKVRADTPPGTLKPQAIAIAAVLFLILCAPIIVLKGPIMRAWPEAIVFYEAIGGETSIPGEALVFDKVEAEIKDDEIMLKGQVINLTSEDKIMPMIEVAARDKDGEELYHWYIAPPQTTLKAEETLPLKAQYAFDKESPVADIRVRFVLKTDATKIASTSGDNTQSPDAGGQAHPHGDAEAAKSPAHGDAPHHPEPSHSNSTTHH